MNSTEIFLSRCRELIASYDRPESLPDNLLPWRPFGIAISPIYKPCVKNKYKRS